MDEKSIAAQCPYCGEWQELLVDPESEGTMVEDCEVCCEPWEMTVSRSRAGVVSVRLARIN